MPIPSERCPDCRYCKKTGTASYSCHFRVPTSKGFVDVAPDDFCGNLTTAEGDRPFFFGNDDTPNGAPAND